MLPRPNGRHLPYLSLEHAVGRRSVAVALPSPGSRRRAPTWTVAGSARRGAGGLSLDQEPRPRGQGRPGRRGWRIAVAMALLALVGAVVVGLSLGPARLARLGREAGLWAERAQRLPLPTIRPVDHASLALGGGKVLRREMRAKVLRTVTTGGRAPVVAIADAWGDLVLGTFDEGALRVGPARVSSLAVDERVNDLAVDAQGRLFVATGGGAFRVRADGSVRRLAPGAFAAVAVWQGKAWFVSARGVSSAEEAGLWTRGREQGFGADTPGAVADCGELLCVGALDGLWLYDGQKASRRSSASGDLPTDWVTSVARAPLGFWAGTFDGGLARVGTVGSRRFSPADGLPDGRVQPHAMAVVGKRLVAGTPAGLLVVEGESAALVVKGLPQREITAVAPGPDGTVWVGTRGGAALVRLEEDAS